MICASFKNIGYIVITFLRLIMYFLSVSVSGMNCGVLLQGRPFGGCSILYHKSLASFISPIVSCSNCFCSVKFVDSCGLSCLFVCVYMPTRGSYSSSDYMNTLGELQGFIASHHFDILLIAGDFNVDFDRPDLFVLYLWTLHLN